MALSSSSCTKETEKDQSKEIPAKTLSQKQPSSSATTPLPWAVDDFFHFSDPEFTDKVETEIEMLILVTLFCS